MMRKFQVRAGDTDYDFTDMDVDENEIITVFEDGHINAADGSMISDAHVFGNYALTFGADAVEFGVIVED